MKQIYFFITTFLWCSGLLMAQSPYVANVLEYKPAPGQFINSSPWGDASSAQTLIGGINGTVSLGAFGGYVILGFDHSIENDPANPYGVDFTIFGNPFTGWSEPGIVYVMKDENNNGQADDTWYQLKGSDYELPSTDAAYSIMYANPGGSFDVPWRDYHNITGVVKANAYHTQPYYPSPTHFPTMNQRFERYGGTLIEGNVDDSNPTYIQSFALDYGYADNHPKQGGDPLTQPDNPATIGIIEGAGGDAMKIEWAIDESGNTVVLDQIDFVKIQTGMNRNCGWLGEASTEVCGVVDVGPIGQSNKINLKATTVSKTKQALKRILILPSNDGGEDKKAGQYHICNVQGDVVMKVRASELNESKLVKLERGIYLAKPADDAAALYKIMVE